MTTSSESSVETSPKIMFTIFIYLIVCVSCISWIAYGAEFPPHIDVVLLCILMLIAYATTIVGVISLIIESLTKHEIILTCIFLTGMVIFSGFLVYRTVKMLQTREANRM
jgi:hypothetical protein